MNLNPKNIMINKSFDLFKITDFGGLKTNKKEI